MLFLSSLAQHVCAATFTWTGDALGSNDWGATSGFPTVTSNWVSGGNTSSFPGSPDTAIFDSDQTGFIIVDLNGTRTVTTARFDGAAPITLNESQLRLTNGDITALGPSSSYRINSSVLPLSAALWNISGGSTELTVTGVVSGTQPLIKSGAGTLVLSGNNTYTNTTTVSSGTLQIGDGGSTGSITGSLINNSTTVFNRSNSLTYNGLISGGGSLVKEAGTLTLTANNSFSGTTTVDSGTLQLGSGGSSGTISGNIVNNTSVRFNRSGIVTYSDVISGPGTLNKSGSGTLRLTGNNTYTGNTIVSVGTLQIGSGGTTGSITGNITNTANVAFNRSDDLTYGGVITGIGSFDKNGAGTLAITGNHNYTGNTTINSGTLELGNGGTSGSLSASSNIINDGNLVFNRSNAINAISIISGSGSVTQNGPGTLNLIASNAYSGGTHLANGLVTFGNEGSIGGVGSPVIAEGGNLRYTGNTTFGSRPFTLTNDLDFEIAVAASEYTNSGDFTGTGVLTKSGPGTLTLTGNNVGGHNKVVESGTLKFAGNGTLGGNIENNGTLEFDRTFDTAFAGVISGTGDLIKRDFAKLTLTGVNTYAGKTTIESGSFEIVNDANLGTGGDVIMQAGTTLQVTGTTTAAHDFELPSSGFATIEVDTGQTYTVEGSISSTGAELRKNGLGTLELNGLNTYGGGTIVQGGTVILANSGSGGVGPIDIQVGQVEVENDASIGVPGATAPSSVAIASGGVFSTTAGYETTIGSLGIVAINGGAINSDRVKLQFGAEIFGSGAVNARVLADTGSTIAAEASLTLGDALSVSGFYSNGDFEIADNVVTLLDSNDAVFDSGALGRSGECWYRRS